MKTTYHNYEAVIAVSMESVEKHSYVHLVACDCEELNAVYRACRESVLEPFYNHWLIPVETAGIYTIKGNCEITSDDNPHECDIDLNIVSCEVWKQ